MKTSFRKRIITLLKGIWHILVIVLLLSLPTFSFFMPGFELSDLVDLAIKGGGAGASGFTGSSSVASEDDQGNAGGVGRAAGFTRTPGGPQGGSRSVLAGGQTVADRNSGASGFGRSGMRDIISRDRDRGSDQTDGEGSSLTGEASSSSDLLEAVLQDLQSLEDTVRTLSSGYESRNYSGSESGRYMNPFLRSLANSTGDPDPGNGDTGGGDTGGGDTGGGDTGGGDTGGGDTGGGGSGGGDTGGGDAEVPVYDSLIIGDFVKDQHFRVLKASRADSGLKYHLEDGTAVDLSLPIIWNELGFIAEYDRGEILLTGDYNGDSRDELLVVEKLEFGDVLTCWVSRNRQITEAFKGSFPYRSISALDFFDWNADGTRELVVAFEHSRNLHIYDINNKTLRYSREFKLPFEPSVLAATSTLTPFKTGYLHVGNDTLEEYVLFSSRYPGVYSFMSPATLRASELIELDNPGAEAESPVFLGVEYDDRLLVLKKEGARYSTVCSFGLRGSSPTASITMNPGSGFLKILLGF